ncbi:DUF5689 domain-containing protein [Vicingaceae bacterium]|nr:DUF5689 domain-containing protein [Vicingaceae bacterium]
MLRTKNIITLILISSIAFLSSCDKDFDSPPIKTLPEGNIITIDSLRNIYNGADITFTEDYSIYGVITADASTGNIYKELYIQDETNAIKLSLTSSADYFIGDKIRVAIKGAILTDDGGRNMITLEEVDPDIAIIKQESGQDLSPTVVTITELTTLVNNLSPHQSKLVQINNVEFQCSEVCKTWADAISQSDQNRYFEDTLGNTLLVRSSGFSSFAGEQLPLGQGSIIAVVSQFNSTVQLTLRTPNEATLYGTRKTTCANCPIHIKNFNDNNLTSGGWTTQNPSGTIQWNVASFSSNYYGNITNGSSKLVGESWLISPAFNLTNTGTPKFNFETATFSANNALKVLISSNYSGAGDPNIATWTDITPAANNLSLGGWGWVTAPDFDLTAYKQPGVYIAFKYTGTSASWDSWEVDNFNLLDL